MTKCDFCTQSDQNRKCPWSFATTREPHCKKAIKAMVKAFQKSDKEGRK